MDTGILGAVGQLSFIKGASQAKIMAEESYESLPRKYKYLVENSRTAEKNFFPIAGKNSGETVASTCFAEAKKALFESRHILVCDMKEVPQAKQTHSRTQASSTQDKEKTNVIYSVHKEERLVLRNSWLVFKTPEVVLELPEELDSRVRIRWADELEYCIVDKAELYESCTIQSFDKHSSRAESKLFRERLEGKKDFYWSDRLAPETKTSKQDFWLYSESEANIIPTWGYSQEYPLVHKYTFNLDSLKYIRAQMKDESSNKWANVPVSEVSQYITFPDGKGSIIETPFLKCEYRMLDDIAYEKVLKEGIERHFFRYIPLKTKLEKSTADSYRSMARIPHNKLIHSVHWMVENMESVKLGQPCNYTDNLDSIRSGNDPILMTTFDEGDEATGLESLLEYYPEDQAIEFDSVSPACRRKMEDYPGFHLRLYSTNECMRRDCQKNLNFSVMSTGAVFGKDSNRTMYCSTGNNNVYDIHVYARVQGAITFSFDSVPSTENRREKITVTKINIEC